MSEKVNDARQQAGASARTVCIDIAKQLSDIVKHTLGPSGLDNMLVDQAKDVVITNDGATIMKESDIDHPVAKVIMDVARTQEEQCFDGTTSSIILTGALMEEASTLLKNKIHPTKIAIGYQIAAIKAEELLLDMGMKVDEEVLDKVAQTAMTGKSAEADKEHLAAICVEVAMAAPLEDINIVRRPNGKIRDSTAIAGLLIDGAKASHEMPDAVEDPKIGLIAADIDIPDYAQALNVQVTNNSEVQQFIEGRNAQLVEMAQKFSIRESMCCSVPVRFTPRLSRPSLPKDSTWLEECAEVTWRLWLTLRVLALWSMWTPSQAKTWELQSSLKKSTSVSDQW